jgi:hypothetical protein
MKHSLIAGAFGILAFVSIPAAAEPTLNLGQSAGINAPEATSYQPESVTSPVRGPTRIDEQDGVFTFNP